MTTSRKAATTALTIAALVLAVVWFRAGQADSASWQAATALAASLGTWVLAAIAGLGERHAARS